MTDKAKSAPPSPPPTPRPETFKRQIEILREIGASPQTIKIAEAVAAKSNGER